MGNLEGEATLEKLAIELGNAFLSAPGNSHRIISLRGQNPETLSVLVKKLELYFRDKRKDIKIQTGSEGYVVDVGYFLD